jgi:GAF domain-containing protein
LGKTNKPVATRVPRVGAKLKSGSAEALAAVRDPEWAALHAELKESLDYQKAVSEVLRVMSRSPADVQPVLDAIVESAKQLVGGFSATVLRVVGDTLHLAAFTKTDDAGTRALRKYFPLPITDSFILQPLRTGLPIQVEDAQTNPDVAAEGEQWRARGLPRQPARAAGARGRSDRIDQRYAQRSGNVPRAPGRLVEDFADQAVIAIENVRLFNETQEALARQTATADILRVISKSPTDVHPVFDAIVRTALRLFPATRRVSCVAMERRFRRLWARTRTDVHENGQPDMPVDPAANFLSRVMVTKTLLHVPDWSAVDLTVQQQRVYDKLGVRSSLMLPLLRSDDCIGVLALGRMTAGAFTEAEIALAKSFVDQALIAIENVRLFNETKEALEQQTAISEILRVISNSPGDVLPMLNAVAERALILCDAAESGIFLVDGDELRFATGYGSMSNFVTGHRQPLTRRLVVGRATIDRETYHYGDIVPLLDTEYPAAKANQAKFVFRAILCVPLMREDRAIGAIALWRTEAQPFTDKQIALVKTFADQAAIAIENVRLVNETKEALEQQKASAEVLNVISSSVADTEPVFNRILLSCEHLFGGLHIGINLVGDDGAIHLATYAGPHRAEFERLFPLPLSHESGAGSSILERRVIHYPDVDAGSDVPEYVRRGCSITGIRSIVFAPMLWEGRGIGAIFVGRDVIQPFSEKEIALLKTFADQAGRHPERAPVQRDEGSARAAKGFAEVAGDQQLRGK